MNTSTVIDDPDFWNKSGAKSDVPWTSLVSIDQIHISQDHGKQLQMMYHTWGVMKQKVGVTELTMKRLQILTILWIRERSPS